MCVTPDLELPLLSSEVKVPCDLLARAFLHHFVTDTEDLRKELATNMDMIAIYTEEEMHEEPNSFSLPCFAFLSYSDTSNLFVINRKS